MFKQLKQVLTQLTQVPVLTSPDFSKPVLETDASGKGLGGCSYFHKNMMACINLSVVLAELYNFMKKNYGVSELEALAVVWVVKHFRVYLYGHKCDVDTDHEAVLSLINHAHPSYKLAHWSLALQELDLMVHYQPGKLNQPADCLSRCSGNALNMDSQANVVAPVQME